MDLKELHDFVEENHWFILLISLLIFTNIFLFVIENNIQFEEEYKQLVHIIELISLVVFTFEYFARVYTAVIKKEFKHPIKGRIKFMLQPLLIIDLIVLIHFYYTLIPSSLAFLRILRLLRFAHLTELSHQKKFLYELFEAKRIDKLNKTGKNRKITKYHKIFAAVLLTLILSNVFIVIFELLTGFPEQLSIQLEFIEYFTLYVFTVEYIMRLWAIDVNPSFKGIHGRLKYAVTPLAIIDLLSVLPFYLPVIIKFDFKILRIFRVTRLIRILKLEEFIN